MRKLLLIILFVNSLYSYAVRLQIDFVQNFNIYVVTANPNFPGQGNTTSDVAINSILNVYNVIQCFNTHDGYNGNYHVLIFIDYNGSNVIGLISDLLANPNVNKVRPCGTNAAGNYTYANKLYVKLLNASDGNPTGTNVNLNIATTNASLNSIFDNYDVTVMDNLIPLHYEIHFDGNINLLKSELDNLDLVVDYTNYVSVAMLNTTEFALDKPKLSPNPFSNTFNIQTDEVILNYSLFNISGKELINTNSKMALDDLSLQLNAGVYFLNLQLENGQKSNYKIVKK